MNKSKRRVSNRIQDEEKYDESTESLLLDENVKKLLDIDVGGPRRRNIFTDAQEPHQRIRRSIITRALRNVISSTPMPAKANGNFFSTECSLNISPITSENDEHIVKEEIKNTISTEPNQPQIVDPNVISVSSDYSDTSYDAKSKYMPSVLKTHDTRNRRGKLGEKISRNLTKTSKELIHSIGNESKSRKVNVNGINQTHFRLPDLSVSLTNDTGLKANDKVDSTLSKIDPCIELPASGRIALKSVEKAHTINKDLSNNPHRTKPGDKTADRIELKSFEKANKSTMNVSKSHFRTKSDYKTSNTVELKSSEKSNRITRKASKSPYRTKSGDRTPNIVEQKSSEKANRVTRNASNSPNRIKVDDKTADNSKLKSAEKCYKISKNVSVTPNRIKTIEKSYKTILESHFPDDNLRSSYTLRKSVNSVCLSPIQESQDFKTPTRPDNCVRTGSVSLRVSSRNVTLRKHSHIDSREQFTVEEQITGGVKDNPEIVIKRLTNLEEKSSKIPVFRTRSKSRENPKKLESQARNRSPEENMQSSNTSNEDNKDALPLSPPKPAPRRRKKKKSALVKSTEKNHSIQKIVEGVDNPPNLQSAYSAPLGCKTSDVFQKRFVDTGTSPNISSSAICDPPVTQSIAVSTLEQVAESSVFPEENQFLTIGSLKRKTSPYPNRVVDTPVSPSTYFSSRSSTDKEERCRRLDDIIAKMTDLQSPLNSSKVQSLEGSFLRPSSNLETVFLIQHKQVQTSLRKSGKTVRKAGSNKKHCARNIFTKAVAETQTSNNNNDDTSLSSGMTDSSKILERYDGNLYESLEKGPIFPESFSSSSRSYDERDENQKAPWRYEDQVVSQSSKRISVKLNFLKSSAQIEEEKTLLSKKRLESEFDTSSSIFEDSGGKIDYIDRNREKQLPSLKSTFRTYKSSKKKAAEDSRAFVERNINSSSELGSDHSVFNHFKRMSSDIEPHETNTEKGVEPEENTLIGIDSGLQRSQIHETTISQVGKGNFEDKLITPQTSKIVSPSRNLSKKDPMILKRKSDVETQKNHVFPSELLTGSAEKENEIHRIIQETANSSHQQKSIIDSYLENQLENGLSDSENENYHEKEQNKYGSSGSKINHSRNISNCAHDTENIPEMNQSKKNLSTHSLIGNNTRSQEDGSEIVVNQMQRETATEKKKGSKTSLSSRTKFISRSESKNQNNFEIDTLQGGNDEETRDSEHCSPIQLNTDNCRIKNIEVSQADDNLGKDAKVDGLSHIEKQRKLSIMLRKLPETKIHRKWSRIRVILDSEDEDDPELHNSKKTPNNRNQFESFGDLVVPLNQTSIRTIPKSPRTVNDVVVNAQEESQKESTKNPESENKKEKEPVFKVPKTKSSKISRKRIFPSSSDDTSVTSEDSAPTGIRRSGRDRRPPKQRYVMDLIENPVRATYKSRTKPVKSDEEREYNNERDSSREKNQEKTQTTEKKARGRPKKATPLPGYNSDKNEDEIEALEPINERHKTTKSAASNLTEDEGNSTKGPATTSKKPVRNKKSTLNSLKDHPETTSKRLRTNSLEYENNSTYQHETSTSKKNRSKKKTILNSLENEHNSIKGSETSKITSLDKATTSSPTEKNLDQMHSITAFNNDNEIDTPSHIQDDPNHFEIGEDSQDVGDDMFLRKPRPQHMISQDSGTSTLLRSNTFEISNLPSMKRPNKVNKSNKKKSKVVSETVPVSPTNEVYKPEQRDRVNRNCLMENEYVNICSGSEIVRLKYVENDIRFQKCQDDLSLTNFIRGMNGATMGYLKLPANGVKPVHTAKKHALCYFVLEGHGKIQVHNRSSKVGKLSHFIIPLGVEYAIMNDGPDDMLLACVRVEGT